MPKFDPVASLRIWAVEVDVGGLTLRIPPRPAADWLAALMALNPLALLDLVEDVDLDEPLMSGALKSQDLIEALESLTESATGRTPWAARMLSHAAQEHWHVIGSDLARIGLRFDRISIGAALDAIYGSMCRVMDEKGIAKFNRALDHPPVETLKAEPIRPPRGAKPLPAIAEQYVRVRPKTVLRRPQDRLPAPTVAPTPQPAPPARSDPAPTAAPPSADHPRPE